MKTTLRICLCLTVVNAVVRQSDGKVLIGGDFTTVNGTGRNRIARLDENGNLDTTFNPGTGATGGAVNCVAVQVVDEVVKVVIGGAFTAVAGTQRSRIARLMASGSLDPQFGPAPFGPAISTQPTDDSEVHSLLVQPSKQILVGGFFTHVAGIGRKNVARLNELGFLDDQLRAGSGECPNPSVLDRGPDDPEPDPNNPTPGSVRAFAIQANNRILLGGEFKVYDVPGVSEDDIKRLGIVRLCGP